MRGIESRSTFIRRTVPHILLGLGVVVLSGKCDSDFSEDPPNPNNPNQKKGNDRITDPTDPISPAHPGNPLH